MEELEVSHSRVSAVVAATELGHSMLSRTIDGLRSQTAAPSLAEIIVVDAYGHAVTEPPSMQRRGGIRVKVIPQAAPNHSAALHRGADVAVGELIWFVADDFVPVAEALEKHLEARTNHPGRNTVTLGPGRFEPGLLRHPFRRWLEYDYDLRRMGFHDTERERKGFFYAGNTVFHKEFYLSTGGFDSSYPYEVVFEQEYELRLSRAGMRTIFVPGAKAHHVHALTLSERSRVMEQAGESCALLKSRHPEHPALLPECTLDMAGHIEQAVLARRDFHQSRSRCAQQDWWRNRLSGAFLKGYAKGWSRIECRGEFSVCRYLRDQHVRRRKASWRASPDQPRIDGLEQFDTPDSLSFMTADDRRACLGARNPQGAPFVYFRAAPGFAGPDIPTAIKIVVRDDQPGRLWIEYDSTDETVEVVPGRAGAFKSTPPIAMQGDGSWRECRFSIPDGRWLTRYVNGGDFRIVRTGEPSDELLVSSVELENLDHEDESHDHQSPLVFPPASQRIELPAADSPDVSIIIPMFMNAGYTVQCLQAITAQTRGNYEVIVVDDGSPDHPGSWLAAIPRLRFLRRPVNGGYARACNAGARLAKGRWLVFLNNDTVPQPGWLDALLAEAVLHPDTGAVGARLLYPSTGTVQHAGVALDQEGLPCHPCRYARADHEDVLGCRDCPAVTGACLLTPADVFAVQGGFNTRYVNGGEDIDYCLRLRESGYRIRYCGASALGHYESATVGGVDGHANERNLSLFREEWIDSGRYHGALQPS